MMVTVDGYLACQNDPDLFLPMDDERAGPLRNRRVAMAKALCRRCPIRLNCEEEALNTHAVGVWGGTTDEEREETRRARAGAAVH